MSALDAGRWLQGRFDAKELHPDSSAGCIAMAVLDRAGDPDEIPILTGETLPHLASGSVVRFRGMVQDMLDPEHFYAGVEGRDGRHLNAMFVDSAGGGGDWSPRAQTTPRFEERRPIVVVPVPGESAWVGEAWRHEARRLVGGGARGEPASAPPTGPSGKRGREIDDVGAQGEARAGGAPVGDGHLDGGGGGRDRAAGPGDGTPSAPGGCPLGEVDEAMDAEAAEPPASSVCELVEAVAPPEGSAIAFLYSHASDSRLNELVEVTGVLSLAPELAAEAGDGASGAWAAELAASRPPTSRVPRLHALSVRVLGDYDEVRSCLGGSVPAATAAGRGDTADVAVAARPDGAARAFALGELRRALRGDALVAELALLQLCARVRRGKGAGSAAGGTGDAGDGQPVGARVLSLTGAPEGAEGAAFARGLAGAVSALHPRADLLGISIPALNAGPMWPQRCPATARLRPSRLQLAPGTVLVVDESGVSDGTLNNAGTLNVSAIHQAATRQRVPYEFEVFTIDQPADLSTIVLSPAGGLIRDDRAKGTPGDGFVRIQEDAAWLAESDADPRAPSPLLARARALLARARAADVSIPAATAERVEADLSVARAAAAGALSQEAMHDWLNLARLLAASHGETELTPARWADAGGLVERLRRRAAGKVGGAGGGGGGIRAV